MASTKREREITSGLFRYLDKPERWRGLAETESELGDEAFYKTFVSVWANNEGNDLNLSIIDALIDKRGVRAETVMPCLSAADRALQESLRDNPLVYRGATIEEPYGDYSWTTDYGRACWFAERCPSGSPAVIHGTVKPDSILFAYAGRNEFEIAVRTPFVGVLEIEQVGDERNDEKLALFFMAQHGELDDLFPGEEMLRLQLEAYAMNKKASFEQAVGYYRSFIAEFEELGFMSAAAKRRDTLEKLLAASCPDLQRKTG